MSAFEVTRCGRTRTPTRFLALAGGVALLILTLRGLSPDESMTWQFAAMKLGATATIVGASAVAFRLGARFIAESSTSKRMELELRAIGPFFADVDDPAVVVDVKQAWVERAFAAGARSSEGDQPTGQEMLGVVGQALDVIRASTSRGSRRPDGLSSRAAWIAGWHARAPGQNSSRRVDGAA